MPVSVGFWKIEFGADLIMKFMRIFLQANDCTWLLNRCVYLFFSYVHLYTSIMFRMKKFLKIILGVNKNDQH